MPKNKIVMDLRAHTSRARSHDPFSSAVADDRGVMIIEVLVSAILLIVMSLAALAVIDRSSEASGANRARSVATALAQSDQDKIRQWPFKKIETYIGPDDPPQTLTTVESDVDGRKYEVKNELEVVEDTNSLEACLARWAKKKVKITTTVTPLPTGQIKSVVMKTYRVPKVSDETGKGSVIVRLFKTDGNGAKGIPVAAEKVLLNNPNNPGTPVDSDTTGDDGCVVLNDLPTDKLRIVWGPKTGWVDQNGASQVLRVVTVAAGKVAQMSGQFDQAGKVDVTFVPDYGTEPTSPAVEAKWTSATFVHSGISTVYNGRRQWVQPLDASGNPQPTTTFTYGSLFPFTSAYGVFAGQCWGNNPDIWKPAAAGDSVLVPQATTVAKQVKMPVVTVNAVNGSGTALSGYYVYLRPAGDVSESGGDYCPSGGIMPAAWLAANGQDNSGYPAKATDGTGVVRYALPYGIWKVCVSNGTKRWFSSKPTDSSGSAPDVASPNPRLNNLPDNTNAAYPLRRNITATVTQDGDCNSGF